MDCWDYWQCKDETKNSCQIFKLNMGSDCWTFPSFEKLNCPPVINMGINDCAKCPFFIEQNNQ